MATIKFILKSNTELSTIYVRLRNGRSIDITASTGYIIDSKFWSNAKGTIRTNGLDNEKRKLSVDLEKLRLRISENLNNANGTEVEINKMWLENTISHFKNPHITSKSESLIESFISYRDNLKTRINPKTGKQISPSTIRSINTTIMHLRKFEENRKKPIRLHEIDLQFQKDFVNFERIILGLAQNSISKDIKQIKTVVIDANDNGIRINDQVFSRKFNVAQEPTQFVTITKEELAELKKYSGPDYLQNARDWLIIGCWTGCRVNDLMNLNIDNVKTTAKEVKFIRYTQSKTAKQVDIPIHPDVLEILERLNSFPRPISDQRFNEWIKIVCKESGMNKPVEGTRQNPETHKKENGIFEKWQLVRSHTCRRSFATNHYGVLPNKIIMAVTGHTTEKMLLTYIGEIENDHLEDYLEVWSTNK